MFAIDRLATLPIFGTYSMKDSFPAHAHIFNVLPTLADIDVQIDGLSDKERRGIMLANEGTNDKAPIERLIRSLYVWAIVTKCSDIHISGRGSPNHPLIYVNVRTPGGFRNFRLNYEVSESAKHWENKLFALTGTPQGATTPEITSTRFDMVLPDHFADLRGLKRFVGESTYNVDIRVEYTRTYNGYAFITRLLDPQRAPTLEQLGLSFALLRVIRTALYLPSGLILTTGPTGSGKTTLQNAMLAVRNDGTCAIHTIEDPVEIALRGDGPIKQIQIGGNITYPRALRSALRSDPDIILIGEIRDLATLDIALQAAATGHLVLATLHTNSAAEAITRMLDLAPAAERADFAYRIAATLKLVLAQRLLDRYEGPRVTRRLSGGEREWLQLNGVEVGGEIDEVVHDGKPCGKVPLIEAIVMTAEIQRLLRVEQVDISEIYKAASDQPQFEPLAIGGVRAVQSHGSTLPEAMTVLEGNMEAQSHPCLRARLAKEHGLGFQAVSDAVDAHIKALDNGEPGELRSFIEAAKLGAIDTLVKEAA